LGFTCKEASGMRLTDCSVSCKCLQQNTTTIFTLHSSMKFYLIFKKDEDLNFYKHFKIYLQIFFSENLIHGKKNNIPRWFETFKCRAVPTVPIPWRFFFFNACIFRYSLFGYSLQITVLFLNIINRHVCDVLNHNVRYSMQSVVLFDLNV
jgi:hypothetical protein